MEVVAGIIYYRDKILCVKRGSGKFKSTSFKYEFPGGKVEPNESLENALIREIKEELEMNVNVENKLCSFLFSYPDFSLKLNVFICRTESEKFILKEHIDYKWLTVNELKTLDWAAADLLVINKFL